MILGGLVGFLIGILAASAQHASGATTLLRGAIGALAAGLVFRWWGKLWLKSLCQARQRPPAPAAPPNATPAKV